jgi:hypothetical protein
MDPVPAIVTTPGWPPSAPANAIAASSVTNSRDVRTNSDITVSLSVGPPLIPKQVDAKKTLSTSTPALLRHSRTTRFSFAGPSAAPTWLQGPAVPLPRMRPLSSPIRAVVLDCPPSTPRYNRASLIEPDYQLLFFGFSTIKLLVIAPKLNPEALARIPATFFSVCVATTPSSVTCPLSTMMWIGGIGSIE